MKAARDVSLSTSSLYRCPSCIHDRFLANTARNSYVYALLLLLTCAPLASKAQNCALYDPPVPGIKCFHGEQVLHTITNSRTSWMVELYSSWCGHCQHFAPAMKELGKDLKQWSSVVRIGVLECTASTENQKICSKFNVGGYPTIRVR